MAKLSFDKIHQQHYVDNELASGLKGHKGLKKWQRFFNGRFERFLKKRIPSSASHQLNHKNLFILPSRFGLAYLFVVGCLFVLATNYENNIILLLSYLLISVFISALLGCFSNLSGLTITCQSEVSGFARQPILIPITIDCPQRRYAVSLQFAEQDPHYIEHLSAGANNINVAVALEQRGNHRLGRLKVSSQYSLGLFTCWTHIAFKQNVMVFPQAKKISSDFLELALGKSASGQKASFGREEFYQLKNHQQGEPLNHISWKQYARGQGLHTKHYQGEQASDLCVRFEHMPSNNLEIKLQYCCYLLLQAKNNGQVVSLVLPNNIISPTATANRNNQTGDDKNSAQQVIDINSHTKNCLMALAMFQPISTANRGENGVAHD